MNPFLRLHPFHQFCHSYLENRSTLRRSFFLGGGSWLCSLMVSFGFFLVSFCFFFGFLSGEGNENLDEPLIPLFGSDVTSGQWGSGPVGLSAFALFHLLGLSLEPAALGRSADSVGTKGSSTCTCTSTVSWASRI